MMNKIEKVYSADLKQLEDIANDLETFCGENEVSSEVVFQFNLSIDELFTNIVTYGYNKDSSKNIYVEYSCNDAEMRVLMRDSGPEFNPFTDAPEPELNGSLEDRNIGGLGIFFVKKNMDEFKYIRRNGMNEVTIIKRFKKLDNNA